MMRYVFTSIMYAKPILKKKTAYLVHPLNKKFKDKDKKFDLEMSLNKNEKFSCC